jgi:hypothetical protein
MRVSGSIQGGKPEQGKKERRAAQRTRLVQARLVEEARRVRRQLLDGGSRVAR